MSAHPTNRPSRRAKTGLSLFACAALAFTAIGTTVSATQANQPTEHRVDVDNVLGSYQKAAYDPADNNAYQSFLVKFADSNNHVRSADDRKTVLDAVGQHNQVQVTETRTMAIGAQVVQVDRALSGDQARAFMDDIAKDAAVAWVQPSYRYQVDHVNRSTAGLDDAAGTRTKVTEEDPDDPGYTKQWYLHDSDGGINVTKAWDVSRGDGVTIGVVDTGVTDHPDLNTQALRGHDFIKSIESAGDGNARDNNPTDEGDGTEDNEKSTWSGTHVGSVAAGATNNSVGIAGVAPASKLLFTRAFGKMGGDAADVNDAAVWAAGGEISGAPKNTNKAKVINISAGVRKKCTPADLAMVKKITELGAVVVTAAGNGDDAGKGGDAVNYSPGGCEGTINVAALNSDGAATDYTNYGSKVTLAAPGGQIDLSAGPPGKNREKGMIYGATNSGLTVGQSPSYGYKEGTGQAASIVSGVVALMWAKAPKMTPKQVVEQLKKTARPAPGGCPKGCGAGMVDPGKAVQNLPQPTPTVTPTVPTVTPTNPRPTVTTQPTDSNPWPIPTSIPIPTSLPIPTFWPPKNMG